MRSLILLFLIIAPCALRGQNMSAFQHVEPPFWWGDMKSHELQIMFYKNDAQLSDFTVTSQKSDLVVKAITKTSNPHYLFVTVDLAAAKPGMYPLKFTSGKSILQYDYEVRAKKGLNKRIQGFNSTDVVYLIMPDRFANGDPTNDSIAGLSEGMHRDKPNGRHGGDLKGVADHFNYFNELGVTALWLNPIIENNQKRSSYHGYSFTDFYKVDGRLGSNEDYVKFTSQAHGAGLKIIQDMVANHMGSGHWMMNDLPEKNWIHQFPKFTKSTFRASTISDPYASQADLHGMADGWFDTSMPDINQTSPLFARYLIQNSLWWIEYAGIDGIRMDTYPYNDKQFMADWAKTIMSEYPSFSIVGEVWMNDIPHTAYWAKGKINKDNFDSGLPSVTDFPLCFSIAQALNEPSNFESGMSKLYNLLSQDFTYPDANTNLIFLDNHDMSRFYLSVNRDINKWKMGIAFLLTTRGIPEIYYGTELLMDGDANSHPNIRRDFPGGWKGDARNAFTAQGRTGEENEAFNFLKTLLNWRKGNTAISKGKLMQFVPEDNVYVYFRYDEKATFMIVLNANSSEKSLVTSRFAEIIQSKLNAKNILTNEKLDDIANIKLLPMSATVLELN